MHKVLRTPGGEGQYVRFVTYVMLALTGVTLALAVFVQPMVEVVVGDSFRDCAKYVPWVAMACLLRSATQVGRAALFVEARTNLEARSTAIGAAVCLAAYIALIPPFGVWGAVVATLLGFGTLLVVGQRYAQGIRPIQFEYGRLSLIAGCAVVVATVGALLPRAHSMWLQILWACGVFALYPALLTTTGFLNCDERARLGHLWARLRDSTRSA